MTAIEGEPRPRCIFSSPLSFSEAFSLHLFEVAFDQRLNSRNPGKAFYFSEALYSLRQKRFARFLSVAFTYCAQLLL